MPATKAARQAKISKPAKKEQPKAEKLKATRKPAKKVEEQPQEEERINTTELRRDVHSAIEAAAESGKPLTVSQVNERFGEFGLSRLGKMLLRKSYAVAGAPAPAKNDSASDRVARLAYAKKVLASNAKGKITVNATFRTRSA